MNSVQIRAAAHMASTFALYFAVVMLIPAAVDHFYGDPEWKVFAFSSMLVGGVSFAVALATRNTPPPVSARFGFLLVNMLWLTICIAGAVPFGLSSLNMSFTDAMFESVSGVTTTGATVISDLDGAPPGILLWRSLLSFMGGLGVLALGLFLLPFLNVGGVSYFKIESTDIEDRPFERLQTFMVSLVGIYGILVFACATAYIAAGMQGFHAVNHAMTTVATGGYSTHTTSFMRYDNNHAILWIGTFFMFIGGLPFSLMMLLAVRGRPEALRDPQIRVYAGYTLVAVLALAIYLRLYNNLPFGEALTEAAFNMVSIITTSGFASEDYTLWGPFAVAAIYLATFLGGCSGSTTGGIKAYRFLIVFELMMSGLKRLVYPSSVTPIRYGERTIDSDMQRAVVLFMASFFVLWGLFVLLLSATGVDFVTAVTGAQASLTNVGPGLGSVIGPVGNFASLPEAANLICMAAMLIGRLEILAVLVVFTPVFWRR